MAGAPGIQRIDGIKAVVQPFGQTCRGPVRNLRERHPGIIGQIGQMFALAARIGDGNQTARHHHAGLGGELQCGGEFIHLTHAQDAMAFEHGVINRIVTGQGSGMTDRHAFAQRRARRLDRNHGHSALARLVGSRAESLRVAHGFQKQADGAG